MRIVVFLFTALLGLATASQGQAQSQNPRSSRSQGQVAAPAKRAVEPPLVLLLDGLGVYVENDYVGVSALAQPLRAQGFRTRVDTHFMGKTYGLVPDIIIGHSMGGSMALNYANSLARSGRPAPLVITIDAAPTPPPCRVRECLNIRNPGMLNVYGARNIDAWSAGATFVNHARLPTHPVVRSLILNRTAEFMATYKARQGARTTTPTTSQRPLNTPRAKGG
ncbi:alpha/beta fold hydrolase [Ancylobacter sp. A5.8]|uniref:alpha/beta fold hydrolase n=1 Tax=Ancylobacter gelatini TaxID=2919920 RepID=UPI001F4D618A|nr:alpha/beta fold hydrolase [Ancylobacter gelatini]MCJ8141676.1 alpha/beta fold hydrolase [Ancylobacter gelatini]